MPTKDDLVAAFRELDSIPLPSRHNETAEEDENGVVTLRDREGVPTMMMGRHDFDEFRNWHQDGPPQMLVPNYSQMEMRIAAHYGMFPRPALPKPLPTFYRGLTSLIALRYGYGPLEVEESTADIHEATMGALYPHPLTARAGRRQSMAANFAMIYGGRIPR